MSVAVFDPAAFKLRYPEFASLADALLDLYFSEAQLYLNNGDLSIVCDPGPRLMLLNMLVAHIARLNATVAGVAPSGNVGLIKSAREGTVGIEYAEYIKSTEGLQAWLNLTPYGAAFWAATAQYRTFQYVTGPGFDPDPFDGYYGTYPNGTPPLQQRPDLTWTDDQW